MRIKNAWALVDSKGNIVFINQQAEVYSSHADAEVGNAEQDGEYTIAPCTLSCGSSEQEDW